MSAAGGQADGKQSSCALRQAPIELGAASRRERLRSTRSIAVSTNRPLRRSRPTRRRLGRGGDSGRLQCGALPTAAWPSTRSSHDRPVGDDRVEIGGGRQASRPQFLVPASPDDPARLWIGRRISAQPLLQFGDRVVSDEVQLERAEAQPHDMAVAVDQPGSRVRPPPSMGAPYCASRGSRVAEHLHDACRRRRSTSPSKCCSCPLAPTWMPLTLVDQRVGDATRRWRASSAASARKAVRMALGIALFGTP